MGGVEPTGKQVEVSGVEINHVEEGSISASWTVSDSLGLMQQLGRTPQPEDSS
jgi:predicted ester cyclase